MILRIKKIVEEKNFERKNIWEKRFMSRWLRPQAPYPFGLNNPSDLVIGYPWLAFLNHVHKNLKFPNNLKEKFCSTKI